MAGGGAAFGPVAAQRASEITGLGSSPPHVPARRPLPREEARHLQRLKGAIAPVVLNDEDAERIEGQVRHYCRVAASAEVRTFGADEDRAQVVRRRAYDRISQLIAELHVEEVVWGLQRIMCPTAPDFSYLTDGIAFSFSLRRRAVPVPGGAAHQTATVTRPSCRHRPGRLSARCTRAAAARGLLLLQ